MNGDIGYTDRELRDRKYAREDVDRERDWFQRQVDKGFTSDFYTSEKELSGIGRWSDDSYFDKTISNPDDPEGGYRNVTGNTDEEAQQKSFQEINRLLKNLPDQQRMGATANFLDDPRDIKKSILSRFAKYENKFGQGVIQQEFNRRASQYDAKIPWQPSTSEGTWGQEAGRVMNPGKDIYSKLNHQGQQDLWNDMSAAIQFSQDFPDVWSTPSRFEANDPGVDIGASMQRGEPSAVEDRLIKAFNDEDEVGY